MNLNRKLERSVKAWFFRAMLGPSMVVDGLVHFCTLTFVSSGLALRCSRSLAKARIAALPQCTSLGELLDAQK